MAAAELDLAAVLGAMTPVGLDDMTAVAALQTRRDQKYVVPMAVVPGLAAELSGDVLALEIDGVRAFRYESVYFDTADFMSYLDAAHSRPRRRKVRSRTYLDSGNCAVEVKARDRTGQTVKHRLAYPAEHRHELNADARAFITEVDPAGPEPDRLSLSLTTAYRRATLLVDDSASRVTIDVGLRCTTPTGRTVSLADAALVETKSAAGSTAVDRLLWRHRLRPVSFSKYCVGMAALHPALPANKWHRILERHFAAERRHRHAG